MMAKKKTISKRKKNAIPIRRSQRLIYRKRPGRDVPLEEAISVSSSTKSDHADQHSYESNDPAYNEESRKIFLEGASDYYDAKIRVPHEQFYGHLSWALAQYPCDQDIVTEVYSVKKKWLQDVNILKQTLEEDCGKYDRGEADVYIPGNDVDVSPTSANDLNEKNDAEVVVVEKLKKDKGDGNTSSSKLGVFNKKVLLVNPGDMSKNMSQLEMDKGKGKVSRNNDGVNAMDVDMPVVGLKGCSKRGSYPDVLSEFEQFVAIKNKPAKKDILVSDTIFSAHKSPLDILFSTQLVVVPRFVFESLIPGSHPLYVLVDTWGLYLNLIEGLKSEKPITRIFFPTNIMVTSTAISNVHYISEIDTLFINQNIVGDCLLFFPILQHNHYFLMCHNMKLNKCFIIDNIASFGQSLERYTAHISALNSFIEKYLAFKNYPNLNKISILNTERLKMPWQTKANLDIDSGIFLMRQMETFVGNGLVGFNAGFKKEGHYQIKQLDCLRFSYLRTILISPLNGMKLKVVNEMKSFENLTEEKMKEIKAGSLERILERVKMLKDHASFYRNDNITE